MTLMTPLWMQPAAGDAAVPYSAAQDRSQLLSAVFATAGVLDIDAGQLAVVQRGAGANFSVDIAAGRAAIRGTDTSDQGTYVVNNSTVKNRTVPSPPASGTRNHRVIARIRDKLHNSAFAVYDWEIQVLTDTGTGLPALPASAISLARVAVAAGQASVTNANITDLRSRASVGTPARVGLIGYASGWGPIAGLPEPSWHVNADGWVMLAGMVRRNGATFTASPGINYQCAVLPPEVRPLENRNFPGATQRGLAQLLTQANGLTFFGITGSPSITQNETWVSLDSCSYRINV